MILTRNVLNGERTSLKMEFVEYSKKYDLPVLLEMKDQYANMKERLEPVRYIVEIAKQAMSELGIKPLIVPIRGGGY